MLGYELFRKNQESKKRIVKNVKPIKKIYMKNGEPVLDTKLRERYGKGILEKAKLLQEFLSMPLNNEDEETLNLPDKRTGTNQPHPYVEIFGAFTISESNERTLVLSISDKNNNFKATLDLNKGKSSFDVTEQIFLRLDKINYKIGNESLYDSYIKSGIIQKNGSLSATTFKKICKTFFNFALSRNDLIVESKKVKNNFSVYILPNFEKISYIEKQKSSNEEKFIDAFGVTDDSYPSKPTRTAKFLSYDDEAFTINCATKDQFYKNLGISNISLEKINIPQGDVFNISGLYWFFTDLSDPYFTFKQTSKGIYHQIYENYKELEKRGSTEQDRIQMKVVCLKKIQAKIEVLIDENMTMDRMKKIFGNVEENRIPVWSFEVLIDRNQKTVLWHEYIKAIWTLITGTKMEHVHLVNYFNMRLRQKIHSWFDKQNEARDFFLKTWFCLENLSKTSTSSDQMNLEEDYAYRIGKIAGRYVKFKWDNKESSNSLRDLLSYSKYDREKLRFVLARIGQGINLSKAKNASMEEISKYIKENCPNEEISDQKAFDDYSYFFYKGVFENLVKN